MRLSFSIVSEKLKTHFGFSLAQFIKKLPAKVAKKAIWSTGDRYIIYRVSQKKRTFRIIILQADTSERSPEAAWSLQARLVGLGDSESSFILGHPVDVRSIEGPLFHSF